MGDIVWRYGPGRQICTETGEWRVTIESLETPPGAARYLVYFHRGEDDPGSLVRSGTEEHVRIAREKAERLLDHWRRASGDKRSP